MTIPVAFKHFLFLSRDKIHGCLSTSKSILKFSFFKQDANLVNILDFAKDFSLHHPESKGIRTEISLHPLNHK